MGLASAALKEPAAKESLFQGVVAKRESKSRSNAGVVETHHELRNQNGEVVFRVEGITLVRTRPRP